MIGQSDWLICIAGVCKRYKFLCLFIFLSLLCICTTRLLYVNGYVVECVDDEKYLLINDVSDESWWFFLNDLDSVDMLYTDSCFDIVQLDSGILNYDTCVTGSIVTYIRPYNMFLSFCRYFVKGVWSYIRYIFHPSYFIDLKSGLVHSDLSGMDVKCYTGGFLSVDDILSDDAILNLRTNMCSDYHSMTVSYYSFWGYAGVMPSNVVWPYDSIVEFSIQGIFLDAGERKYVAICDVVDGQLHIVSCKHDRQDMGLLANDDLGMNYDAVDVTNLTIPVGVKTGSRIRLHRDALQSNVDSVLRNNVGKISDLLYGSDGLISLSNNCVKIECPVLEDDYEVEYLGDLEYYDLEMVFKLSFDSFRSFYDTGIYNTLSGV